MFRFSYLFKNNNDVLISERREKILGNYTKDMWIKRQEEKLKVSNDIGRSKNGSRKTNF